MVQSQTRSYPGHVKFRVRWAMNHAMQSLQSMAGGLPVEEIMKKSFEDLRPEDQRHLERYRIRESVLGRCGHTFNHVSRRTPPAGASFSSDLCHEQAQTEHCSESIELNHSIQPTQLNFFFQHQSYETMGIARVQLSTNPCQMEQPRPHDTMYDAWVMTLDRIRPARVMRGRVMITDHCHRQERFIIRPSY